MNPVLILTRNCLELTKKCVESVRGQDIETCIHIYDNQSSDGTQAWIASQEDIIDQSSGVDLGVSAGWNFVLEILFKEQWERPGHKLQGWGAKHVLVLNNDVIIPSWFLTSLLAYDVPFVTGVSVKWMHQIESPQPAKELAPCPDFSAFLIRRDCWQKVGPFDENMKLYASDLDWHIRAHREGVRLLNSGVHFYHERSSTLNRSPDQERRQIQLQADADRAVFKSKWGVGANDPAYADLFTEETFGIDAK